MNFVCIHAFTNDLYNLLCSDSKIDFECICLAYLLKVYVLKCIEDEVTPVSKQNSTNEMIECERMYKHIIGGVSFPIKLHGCHIIYSREYTAIHNFTSHDEKDYIYDGLFASTEHTRDLTEQNDDFDDDEAHSIRWIGEYSIYTKKKNK